MLAVESSDAGRSMMEASKARCPSSSTAFLAESRATSPISQCLAAPRGALARQSPPQTQRRTSGGSKVIALGGALLEAFTLEGSCDREVLGVATSISNARDGDIRSKSCNGCSNRGGSGETSVSNDNKDNIDSSNSYGPTSKHHCLLDEESMSLKTRGVRTEGTIVGGAGEGVQSRGTCGEAWGSTDVTGIKGAQVDRNGAGSSRGGKSAASSDVWAWAGVGGSTTRGNAMLTAYGLQPDKLNPICPSRTPGTETARHGRWQRVGSVGCRENRGVNAEDGWGKYSVQNHEVRKESGGGDDGRVRGGRKDEGSSARTTSVHNNQGFRGGKNYKQRLYVTSGRASSTTRRSGRSPSVVRRVAGASSSRGEDRLVAMTKEASPHQSIEGEIPRKHGMECGTHPPGNNRLALVDLLIPPNDSPANAVRSTPKPNKDGQAGDTTETDVAVASVPSGQIATLTMDGRGGTAAPPHRPHQLTLVAPATSASYAAVFPDLKTTGGTGGEMAVAFEPDYSREQGPGWSNAVCADNTKATVSRPRELPHKSQCNSRKNPPGCPGKLFLGSDSVRLHHSLRALSFTGEGKSGSEPRPGTVAPSALVSVGTAHSCRDTSDDFLSTRISTAGVETVDRLPATPPLALIEHFKQARRPASRRGTRKQGAGGDASPPAPALCLFSGHRGDQDQRFGRAVGTLEWRRKR